MSLHAAPKKQQIDKSGADLAHYKGCFYNEDDSGQHFIDPVTGAHFVFQRIVEKLLELQGSAEYRGRLLNQDESNGTTRRAQRVRMSGAVSRLMMAPPGRRGRSHDKSADVVREYFPAAPSFLPKIAAGRNYAAQHTTGGGSSKLREVARTNAARRLGMARPCKLPQKSASVDMRTGAPLEAARPPEEAAEYREAGWKAGGRTRDARHSFIEQLVPKRGQSPYNSEARTKRAKELVRTHSKV